jgi:hypothetical protein
MLWLLLLPTAVPPYARYVDVSLPQPITFREKLTWTGTLRGRLGPTPLVAPVADRAVELLPTRTTQTDVPIATATCCFASTIGLPVSPTSVPAPSGNSPSLKCRSREQANSPVAGSSD